MGGGLSGEVGDWYNGVERCGGGWSEGIGDVGSGWGAGGGRGRVVSTFWGVG